MKGTLTPDEIESEIKNITLHVHRNRHNKNLASQQFQVAGSSILIDLIKVKSRAYTSKIYMGSNSQSLNVLFSTEADNILL